MAQPITKTATMPARPLREIRETEREHVADEYQNAASMTLDVDGSSLGTPLGWRTFSSGSKGYAYSGKLDGSNGRRYQVSVNIVLIGSKPTA